MVKWLIRAESAATPVLTDEHRLASDRANFWMRGKIRDLLLQSIGQHYIVGVHVCNKYPCCSLLHATVSSRDNAGALLSEHSESRITH
jgi:hypothetical protein